MIHTIKKGSSLKKQVVGKMVSVTIDEKLVFSIIQESLLIMPLDMPLTSM